LVIAVPLNTFGEGSSQKHLHSTVSMTECRWSLQFFNAS